MKGRNSLFNSFDQLFAVFSFQHDNHARYGLAVSKSCTFRRRRSDPQFGHIPDQNGCAILGSQHDIAEVVSVDSASAANERELFGGMFDVSATEIGVVLFHSCSYVVKRETIL